MFTIFVPKKAKVAEKKPVETPVGKKAEKAEKTEKPVAEKKVVKKAAAKDKADPKGDDEIF
jgi:hypothetical protein